MEDKVRIASSENWDMVVAKNFQQIEAIRPSWEQMQIGERHPTPQADIDRFRSIVESLGGGAQPYVMLLKSNDEPKTIVIGRLEKTRIKCSIGYKTLLELPLNCLSVVYGGIIGQHTDETCAVLIQKATEMLARDGIDAICLSRLAPGSAAFRQATTRPNPFCRTHLPRVERHWSMTIPRNIEAVYKSLAPKTRNTVGRKIRKLERQFAGQIKVVTYRGENECERAIGAAASISQHTYHAGLGAGLVDNAQTREMMKVAACHGWLCMSVLYIKDEPCSFQLGLQYGKTYFLEQLGFNPTWKEWNVGTYLFNKVLEELCLDPRVEELNFGFGDAQYKRTYGTEQWEEASVYVFALRPYPVLVNTLQTFIMALNVFFEYVFNKVGGVNWIKRRWRNLFEEHVRDQAPESGHED